MRTTLISLALAAATASSALATEWKKLIEPSELAALDNVVIVDIRAPEAFAGGHIEDALNAPYATWRGPKANPGQALSDAALTERLQSLGLERDDRVVVTFEGKTATDFGAAARVYWTLKSAGLGELAILNGGQTAWTASGLAVSKDARTAQRSTQTFTLSDDWMIDRAGVAEVVGGASDAQIVDARPAEFLAGKKKHKAAKVAGTLEGAANVRHSTWFSSEKTSRIDLASDIRAKALAAGVEDGTDRPVASFCNTGHWAATNWFALSELAGIDNVKLYPESLVGWTNADMPTVTVPVSTN